MKKVNMKTNLFLKIHLITRKLARKLHSSKQILCINTRAHLHIIFLYLSLK